VEESCLAGVRQGLRGVGDPWGTHRGSGQSPRYGEQGISSVYLGLSTARFHPLSCSLQSLLCHGTALEKKKEGDPELPLLHPVPVEAKEPWQEFPPLSFERPFYN
jgi:hypothetical protein